jgi:hypothetical protein
MPVSGYLLPVTSFKEGKTVSGYWLHVSGSNFSGYLQPETCNFNLIVPIIAAVRLLLQR